MNQVKSNDKYKKSVNLPYYIKPSIYSRDQTNGKTKNLLQTLTQSHAEKTRKKGKKNE